MWMHLDQDGYRFSRAGIATSDTPAGPFTFIKAIRPIADTNNFSPDNDDSAFSPCSNGVSFILSIRVTLPMFIVIGGRSKYSPK